MTTIELTRKWQEFTATDLQILNPAGGAGFEIYISGERRVVSPFDNYQVFGGISYKLRSVGETGSVSVVDIETSLGNSEELTELVVRAETAEAGSVAAQALAEAARDGALGAVFYNAVSAGLAAAADGQFFSVRRGDSATLYLDNSGVAENQEAEILLPDATAALQAVKLGASAVVAGSFAVAPIIDINFAALLGRQGRVVPGYGVPSVPRNMVPRNSGRIIGALSAGTATEFYANGPQGAQTAKRLQMNNSAAYDIVKDTIIPAGPFTVKVKAKSNAGQGTANFQIGVLSGGGGSMASVSTTEAGWTTLTTTVTPNGASDTPRVCLFNNSGAAIDILIDEVQWYWAEETIPAFADEVIDAPVLRDEVSYFDALASTAYHLDTRTKTVRGFIPFPTFPLTKTFTEVTMMALVKSEDITKIATKMLSFDSNEGTLTLGANNGKIYAAPPLPRLTTNPAHWLPGTGWHVMTLRVKAGEQAFWLDKVKHWLATAASPTIPVKSGLMLGNDEGTTGREFLGLYSQVAVWDHWLSDANVRAAVDVMHARHRIANGAQISTRAVWFAEGDSITENARAATDGPGYQAQYAQASTGDKGIVCVNNAVSGSQLSHLTTRLTSTGLTDRIAAAVASGYQVVATVLIGANGLPTIGALETYWNALKSAGAQVVACTILPRDDGTINNTARAALNVEILASSVPDAKADLAANADIGAAGAPTAGVYYYDLVHLNAAGHAIAMGIIAPIVEELLAP